MAFRAIVRNAFTVAGRRGTCVILERFDGRVVAGAQLAVLGAGANALSVESARLADPREALGLVLDGVEPSAIPAGATLLDRG